MAEELSDKLGEDTVICIFPGGLAASPIDSMNKGKDAYNKFLYERSNILPWDILTIAIISHISISFDG